MLIERLMAHGRCFLETGACPPTSPSLASDHPHVFKKDVVERAKSYTAGLGGGVGAYTNSQGIPAVREVRRIYRAPCAMCYIEL